MKRKLLIAVPLLLLVALAAWMLRPRRETLGEAFVSEKVASLLSGIAQVREPVGTLHYGERVDVVGRRNDYVKVRTNAGTVGWVESRQLMEPALWQRSVKLLDQTRGMSVQARGRTKVSTNLRVQPGRTQPRLYQFARNVPVEIVGRAVADWAQTTDEKDSSNDPQETKKEDWFLVRALATRPPGEAAANIRPLAWFELNRVSDLGGDKPQYLLAATRGPEGQGCDFTALRVYTWYVKKSRYETAFIENNLCGQLPVRVGKGPKGEPEFRFWAMDGNKEERIYHLNQTVVRRIRDASASSGKNGSAKQAKTPAR